jgi:hypothetical protein
MLGFAGQVGLSSAQQPLPVVGVHAIHPGREGRGRLGAVVAEHLPHVNPMSAAVRVDPVRHVVFPEADVRAAHRQLQAGVDLGQFGGPLGDALLKSRVERLEFFLGPVSLAHLRFQFLGPARHLPPEGPGPNQCSRQDQEDRGEDQGHNPSRATFFSWAKRPTSAVVVSGGQGRISENGRRPATACP